ncbi:MAG: hypothetical protein JSR96_14980, partial [Proteobacteria bacterium]|nr:hypothetical protein [Pseudomonadota bacterium]
RKDQTTDHRISALATPQDRRLTSTSRRGRSLRSITPPKVPNLLTTDNFVFYNFTRIHKTLRMSPAMAAGITDRLWSLEDVIAKIDELAPALKVRGPYKKHGDEISN